MLEAYPSPHIFGFPLLDARASGNLEWGDLPGIELYCHGVQSRIRLLPSYLPHEAELSRSGFDL